MASLAGYDLMEEGVLSGLPLPITLRLPVPMSDDELIAFSRRNRPYRVEQNAKRKLEIMSPVGEEGSETEAEVIFELGMWPREHGGHFFSSNDGCRLPDGSVFSPDAAWIAEERGGCPKQRAAEEIPPTLP